VAGQPRKDCGLVTTILYLFFTYSWLECCSYFRLRSWKLWL